MWFSHAKGYMSILYVDCIKFLINRFVGNFYLYNIIKWSDKWQVTPLLLFIFFFLGKVELSLKQTILQHPSNTTIHPTWRCTFTLSPRLKQIQTVATKKIQLIEWCLCVDINLYLNNESVTHTGQKPMTRLIHAQSKLWKESPTKQYRISSKKSLSAEKATNNDFNCW
jgi:hypothetical protein